MREIILDILIKNHACVEGMDFVGNHYWNDYAQLVKLLTNRGHLAWVKWLEDNRIKEQIKSSPMPKYDSRVIPFPKGYDFDFADKDGIHLRLIEKSLLEYCNQHILNDNRYASWYSLITSSELNEFITNMSKGEAIDILQLIADDYNGEWKYEDGKEYYNLIWNINYYYLDHCQTRTFGTPKFKDNKFNFNPYIKLLDKIYK